MTRWRRVENDQREVVLIERLYDLAEACGFVNSWHGCHEILHETHGVRRGLLILALRHAGLPEKALEHAATSLIGRWVDLHSEKIAEVLDSRRFPSEFLIESIGQVVSRISRDNQDLR